MNISKNKQLVIDFFNHLNEQRMKEGFEMLSEELNWWILGNIPVSGNYDKRKISLGLKLLHRSFDRFRFNIGVMTADRKSVV